MDKENHYDLIIVGQGLAGSVLAMRNFFENKSVLIIDQPKITNSSKVAAGIWNPVVFKRLTKSWKADEIIPYLNQFYGNCEKIFGCDLLFRLDILKILPTDNEINFWKEKSAGEMKNYLQDQITELPSEIKENFNSQNQKCANVKQSGYLNINVFLKNVKEFFQNKNAYLEEEFNHSKLIIEANCVRYNNYSSSFIIFCEGVATINNPWFKNIPFKPAKGEVLTLKLENHKIKQVINKNFFILPISDDLVKIGSTYNWTDLSELPTTAGRNEIEGKFKTLCSGKYVVTNHEAGVRPASMDRRPIIGDHETESRIKIFNGFGTKGVMLAPYFAENFINCIFNHAELEPEVNVQRFYTKK